MRNPHWQENKHVSRLYIYCHLLYTKTVQSTVLSDNRYRNQYMCIRELTHLSVWRRQWGDSRVTHALCWRGISHRICRGRQRKTFTIPHCTFNFICSITHLFIYMLLNAQIEDNIFFWKWGLKKCGYYIWRQVSYVFTKSGVQMLNGENGSVTPAPTESVERQVVACL